MIRNEAEYQEASARLADERQRLTEHRARLAEAGLGEEEIKRVIDPMESFHLQLKEEVASYERLNSKTSGDSVICSSRFGLQKGFRSASWQSGFRYTSLRCRATSGTNISGSRLNAL